MLPKWFLKGSDVMPEKKSTYVGYTESRKRANEKYLKESVEDKDSSPKRRKA